MNEGFGYQIRVANSYRNGNITKKMVREICEEQNWEYKFDKEGGVMIYSRICFKPINYPIYLKKKSWLSRYNDSYLIKELERRGYIMIKVNR